MTIRLSEIMKNESKREMYLLGFIHGNTGIAERQPSYDRDSYEYGYKDGKNGKVKNYLKVSEVEGPKQKQKSLTRQKGKHG